MNHDEGGGNKTGKRDLIAGLLIGVPIGGEINAYVAYGVYLNQFGLPNDPLGIGLGVAGVISFLAGLGILAKRGIKPAV